MHPGGDCGQTTVLGSPWWSKGGSNSRPQQCDCCALPSELLPHITAGSPISGLGDPVQRWIWRRISGCMRVPLGEASLRHEPRAASREPRDARRDPRHASRPSSCLRDCADVPNGHPCAKTMCIYGPSLVECLTDHSCPSKRSERRVEPPDRVQGVDFIDPEPRFATPEPHLLAES